MALRVHVICGGGTGSRVVRLLHEAGVLVTAGILAASDADAETCRSLGIDVVLTPAREPPSPDTEREAERWMRSADAVVVTPFAVGKSNMTNLSLASRLPESCPIYLLQGGDISQRDHTGGAAIALYRSLEQRARATASNAPELVRRLLPDGSAPPR